MSAAPPRALEGIRVLDVGGAATNYCGKLFAELGADVILVEPPQGSALRHEPPFADDIVDVERSLQFFYRNTSKRSIVVDTSHDAGAEVLRHLAGSVDLVIEDGRPRSRTPFGLSVEQLVEQHPGLVVTSITPFGQQGPYAEFEDSDLVLLAMGGLLWMGGYADGPPVRAVGDQAYMAGALFGAVGSMVALTHAELQGEGQHVDVSVQEAVVMGLENAAQFYDLEGVIRRRFGGTQRQAGFGVFPCADGHLFLLAGGVGGNRFWGNLVDWIRDDGSADADRLDTAEWADRSFLETAEAKETFWEVFTAFVRDKPKLDLYHESQVWRVPLCPINAPSDVHASKQLASRDYFVDMEAFGRTFPIAGAPYRLSETPWRMTGPAPALGAHTDEVLAGFGFSEDARSELRAKGAIR